MNEWKALAIAAIWIGAGVAQFKRDLPGIAWVMAALSTSFVMVN